MEIEISKDVQEKVEKASRQLGLTKQEVVALALRLYLRNLKEFIELKKEMDAWEKLSDEALENFEKSQ